MANKATDHLPRFQALFRGRESAHGKWKKGSVKTLATGASEQDYREHLEARNGPDGPFLGIVPIRHDNSCYFGAIDLDDDAANHAALAAIIEHAQLPLVVCRSKSGGAHLYLFTKEPVTAGLMRKKLKSWAAKTRLLNPNGSEPEIFPKQSKLTTKDQGNWINLPYYGGDKSNRYAFDNDGKQLRLSMFLELAEQRRVGAIELEGLEPGGEDSFPEGPPCLNTLDKLGYPEGSRNMGLFNVGIFYKGVDPDGYEDLVKDYNHSRMDPPLKDSEVKGVLSSLRNRDYIYKCEELPIQPHCDKPTCKKQKYGIGMFRAKKLAQGMPEVAGLKKITTDPPRWSVNVAGKEVELQTDDLMLIPRFRRLVLERCNLVFPLLKQHEWDDVLSTLLSGVDVITAPEDAGALGAFHFLVGQFLLRRKNSESRQDLLRGLPFEEDDKVYFRSTDLMSFLERNKFRDFNTPRIYTALKSIGAGHSKFNILNKGSLEGTQLWWLPVPRNEQTEDFKPSRSKEPRM